LNFPKDKFSLPLSVGDKVFQCFPYDGTKKAGKLKGIPVTIRKITRSKFLDTFILYYEENKKWDYSHNIYRIDAMVLGNRDGK